MADSLNKNKATRPEGENTPDNRKEAATENEEGSASNSHKSVTISDIEKLFVLMRENEIAELEIEQYKTKIHIVSKGAPASQPSMVQYMPTGMQPMQMMPMQNQQPGAGGGEGSQGPAGTQLENPSGAGEGAGAASSAPANSRTVLSPMVGTFYRSPGPDSPLFVNEGDIVNEETVLCIIEAMKLMNEIKAETRGKILRVLVENGMPVEFNQPLFLLEP